MLNPMYYRKKVSPVQAVQWDGSLKSAGEIIKWASSWSTVSPRYHEINETLVRISPEISFSTIAGLAVCHPTDWVTVDEDGVFKKYTEEEFKDRYVLV